LLRGTRVRKNSCSRRRSGSRLATSRGY
jgi:hypothetical protein